MSFKMKLFLVGCMVAVFGVSTVVLAADDNLEGLLQELGGTKKPAAPADKPAEVKPAAEPAPVAPVAEPAPVAPAEKPAEVKPPAPVAEPAPVAPVAEPAPVAPAEKPAEVKPAAEAMPVAPAAEPAPAAPVAEPAPAVAPVADVAKPAEVTPAAPVAEVTPAAPSVTAEAKPLESADEKSQIISELNTLETTRLKSMDDHGFKLLENADKSFKKGDYMLACEQYKQAQLFIVNRPANAVARKRAADGEAESYYLEASALFKIRELGKAKAMAEEAHRRGHVKAARLLELIKQEPEKALRDNSSISHRLNESDYKTQRDEVRKRLRRSRQYFTTAEYTRAIEECELVLRDYPGNDDAITLRQQIAEKMKVSADSEFEATRAMMIKDVVRTWTPDRYASDSPQLPKGSNEVVTKTPTVTISDTKSAEQVVNKKLKTIVIPEVTFRPPATIVDAIDFFKQASRDYDDPEIPLDQRGVNLILKLASTAQLAPAEGTPAAADPFAASATASTGIPVIPAMSARFINLFDALKLVCDVTGMKFRISGNIVMIVPLNDPDEKLVTRSYNVLPTLSERLGSASSELSSTAGGARTGESTFMSTESMGGVKDEEKWKQFFQQMGVSWPIGSSISYLSTIGKLRVTNTSEWLATFEQVLEDLNVTPRLVEIETRFVEVSQNDLNSLGFEWLLNGDFSWSASGFAENVLGLKNFSNNQIPLLGMDGAPLLKPDGTPMTGYAPYTQPGNMPSPPYAPGQYGQVNAPNHNMGMNAMDGTATGYSTGMRYLNTLNNPIVGEGAPVNDKFMKLNAFIGGADVSLILHALCQRSDTDVLSAPKVTTKSGQEAIMKVVTEYIYPSEFNVQISQQGNTGGGLNSGGTGEPIAIVEPQNFTMREVGVILQVVPEVSSEGQMINLTMKPQVVSEPVWKNYGTKLPKTVTEPTGILDNLGLPIMATRTEYVELPMEQPFFTVRSVETQLLVYNGATVVMGGLITEERKTMEDKVPFLGDIPYLGRFFQSRSEQSEKRNLLIFVTARLVDPAGRAVRTSGNESSLATPGGTPMTPAPVATPAPAPVAATP